MHLISVLKQSLSYHIMRSLPIPGLSTATQPSFDSLSSVLWPLPCTWIVTPAADSVYPSCPHSPLESDITAAYCWSPRLGVSALLSTDPECVKDDCWTTGGLAVGWGLLSLNWYELQWAALNGFIYFFIFFTSPCCVWPHHSSCCAIFLSLSLSLAHSLAILLTLSPSLSLWLSPSCTHYLAPYLSLSSLSISFTLTFSLPLSLPLFPLGEQTVSQAVCVCLCEWPRRVVRRLRRSICLVQGLA